MNVSRGRVVMTYGPWSNGHQEQAAIVTNVYGQGEPGSLVNLHVFLDLGQPMIFNEVPWYPTKDGLIAALGDSQLHLHAGVRGCYFPERAE